MRSEVGRTPRPLARTIDEPRQMGSWKKTPLIRDLKGVLDVPKQREKRVLHAEGSSGRCVPGSQVCEGCEVPQEVGGWDAACRGPQGSCRERGLGPEGSGESWRDLGRRGRA